MLWAITKKGDISEVTPLLTLQLPVGQRPSEIKIKVERGGI